jgi:hypothetical protein
MPKLRERAPFGEAKACLRRFKIGGGMNQRRLAGLINMAVTVI